MIPKKLHYCWFGKGKKPDILNRCLDSWKRYCPDYEIIEWNESNTARFQHKFYKDAYRKKQFAFVADCVRVQVLYEQGGFYLDTDMLLVRPLDSLTHYRLVIGEEVPGRLNFAFFASEPQNHWVGKMKDYYETHTFNPFSVPVITHTFSPMFKQEHLSSGEQIFPPEVFYPLPYEKRGEEPTHFMTEHTLAVHLWDHSWKTKKNETTGGLWKNLWTVVVDSLIYAYPRWYFKRYAKEFSRKIYHRMIGKKVG